MTPNHSIDFIEEKKEFISILDLEYDRELLSEYFNKLSKEASHTTIYSYQHILDALFNLEDILVLFKLLDHSLCYLGTDHKSTVINTINSCHEMSNVPFNGNSIIEIIEDSHELEHPMEKTAIIYLLSEKGCAYSLLCIGARCFSIDDNEPRIRELPVYALNCFSVAFKILSDNESSSYAIYIKSFHLSLLSEAKAKYCILSDKLSDIVSIDTIGHLEWLLSEARRSSPYYRIALDLKSKIEAGSQQAIFSSFTYIPPIKDITLYKLSN
jgi:hypothetical protein